MMMIISSTPSMGEEEVRVGIKSVWCSVFWRGHTHALATDDVCQPTEEELSNEGTNGGGNLETEILIRSCLLTGTVDIADHDRGDVNGKDIITKKEKKNVRLGQKST